MNAAVRRPNGGLPVYHLDAVARRRAGASPAGTRARTARSTRTTSARQTEALLDAATVPATIVNWGGDEAVSVQEWCAFFAELTGHDVPVDVVETPGTLRGRSPTPPRARPWPDRAPCRGATACADAVRGEARMNVLVTGASSGIGAATALAFAERGATVGICAPP